MLIIDMPKKYLTDASGFVSCAMCQKYLPLLYRNCHKDFKGCLIKGELPEEHGDLIDRDDMCDWIRSRIALTDSCAEGKPSMLERFERDVLCTCLHDFVCAEAVIAAERKDDE